MDIDKKTILAFILIGLILIFVNTEHYKKLVLPERQYVDNKVTEKKEEIPFFDVQKPDSQVPPKDMSVSEEKSQRAFAEDIVPISEEVRVLESLKQGQEKDIVVKTKLYQAQLSTRGATIKSWLLEDYTTSHGQRVQLIPENSYGNLGIVFPMSRDTVETYSAIFSVDRREIVLDENTEKDSVTFKLQLGQGKSIVKKFVFYNDSYTFDLDVEFNNLETLVSNQIYSLVWKSGLAYTEVNIAEEMNYSRAYTFLGGELEELKIKNKPNIKDQKIHTGDIDWVAIRTKYFVSAIIPREKKGASARLEGEAIPLDNGKIKKRYATELTMVLSFDTDLSETQRFNVLVGPLDYDILRKNKVGLEKMVNLGWWIIRPISVGVLWSFKTLHKVIPNYGVVIIIFSILIKIVLAPLTKKSFTSMKEMQALQPQLAELKEKYGKDPQRLNKETMKLYKEYGVNPMGGCLPMVLQMPLLYALFMVFRTTIELRGEGFVGWIKDLSAPDTVAVLPFSIPFYGNLVNILPIFMGATMLIQQKMSMKDPKQKAMVYIMPIFLTLIFNSFPSGLNLYYALFNLLSIIHQKITPEPEIVKKDDPKNRASKKKKGFSSRTRRKGK